MVTGRGDRQVLLGAVCWTATLQYFVVQAVAQAAWRTPYSLVRNYVSDLGNTTCGPLRFGGYSQYVCSPLHLLMNASFVTLGLLMLAGAVLTWRVWPWERLATWGGFLFLSGAALGVIVVGLAPENVSPGWHHRGAYTIPAGDIALVLLGLALWRLRPWLAGAALALGLVGLIAYLLYTNVDSLVSGVGAWERVADYPLPLWLAGVGLTLLFRPLRAAPVGSRVAE